MTLEAFEKIALFASDHQVSEVPGAAPREKLRMDTVEPGTIDAQSMMQRNSSNKDDTFKQSIRTTYENGMTDTFTEGSMSTEMPVQGFWKNLGNELGITNFKPQTRTDIFSSLTQFGQSGNPVYRHRQNSMYMGGELASRKDSDWGNFVR